MKNRFIAIVFIGFLPSILFGQTVNRLVSSAVPFLTFSPDSRAAAMGDAGVASTPDANSIYWNTSKLAFADQNAEINFSYAPWLRDLVGDMGLINAAGYKKVGEGKALTFGFTYFDQG